jgi:HPt (histidine-containing phosphotransfer) domain-containing protein
VINMDIFGQIIELDDEDDYSFSWEMVTAYFSQAEQTFTDMDKALCVLSLLSFSRPDSFIGHSDSKDLKKLSELGHFLKGSSAALGISKLQATCENIQHYGELRDEEKGKDLKPDQALTLIGTLLKGITGDFAAAKKWFINWYKEHGVEEAAELE